ncbi:diacylglycerol/lipid kinase family protein [Gemelliphila palaticanis]|uniref:DAGKc domain-containing protein n=1 Tax=Gemelliphila palaticanis TaxID=81950 RepID=A0ABX2SZZ3_9BACL|nr:diacylglycerol kinase family protein [Gemella palaticanis]MBF0715954.1 hypothetical protein [Gemella palaticanis]NYS47884.1 hypothetical protein [Gemella palaticanis]
MKSISILVYLNAGGINGKSSLARLQSACNNKNINYKIYISEYPKHTKTLVNKIVEETKNIENHRIVVVGGDGTLNEALHGLVFGGYNYPIAYFPSGTGNDFARSLNLTLDENKFLDELFLVKEEKVELIKAKNIKDNIDFVALNGIGIGFDAVVSNLHNVNKAKITRKFKKLSYISEIMNAYKESESYEAKIVVDDKTEYLFSNILFLSFMNNSYYGGGIKIDPYAYKNNNSIGLIVVKDVTKKIIPKLLYHVLFTKKQFEKTSNIIRIPGKKFKVFISEPRYIQTDGEVSMLKNIEMELSLSNYPFYLVER